MLSGSLPKLAVFASGNGGNFEALALADRRDTLGGRVTALFCDRPEAHACDRARRLGIEVVSPPIGRYRTRIEDESVWLAELQTRTIEYVLLAGFMRRLHTTLLSAYPDRILNIHPSLLPAFPGIDAIDRAFEYGVRVTGCTVHLVDDGLDQGAILDQSVIEVREGDTLEHVTARVHEAEHALYADVVRRFLADAWHREGRRMVLTAREAKRG